MKSTHDNPLDPLGSLGAPIRPTQPATPDVVKPFNSGDWAPKGLVIHDDKPAAPANPKAPA